MEELLFEFYKILSLLRDITSLDLLGQFCQAILFIFIELEVAFRLIRTVVKHHVTGLLVIDRVTGR